LAVPEAAPEWRALSSPNAAAVAAAAWTLAPGPVATVRMSSTPPTPASTVTVGIAASTTAFTSATSTARRFATLPPPTEAAPGNASTALAVPPVTCTRLAVPSVSLASLTMPPGVVARPPTITALMAAATSVAVALAMSAKSAAENSTVCSRPLSTRRSSSMPSASAYGPAPPAAIAAAEPLNTASASGAPSTARRTTSPSCSTKGPGTAPSRMPGVGPPPATRKPAARTAVAVAALATFE
jgi:hypothetical protein